MEESLNKDEFKNEILYVLSNTNIDNITLEILKDLVMRNVHKRYILDIDSFERIVNELISENQIRVICDLDNGQYYEITLDGLLEVL